MATIKLKSKPIVLVVLDGWGLSPSWGGNAISMNNPDNYNFLWRTYPHKILQAFMPIVNPGNKVGNSEIGHSCLGGGRLVKQDCSRISESITDGTFNNNQVLKNAFANAQRNKVKTHFVGLVSDGWVHSHSSHLLALLNMAKIAGVDNVYIHAITDGVDTPPSSGVQYISALAQNLEKNQYGKIATICGRYYGMDRDNHWDRTASYYQTLIQSFGRKSESATHGVSQAYSEGFTDENLPPTVITENGQPIAKISDNDLVVFFNFRADRMGQIVNSFINPNALKKSIFGRQYPLVKINAVTLTSYRLNLPVEVAFPYIYQKENLTEILSANGLYQLHLAESEKKAHVTYFFDGGTEKSFPGEKVEIIPSPNVSSYDLKPEMSAFEITNYAIKNLKHFDLILINYANVDMIGHTGNISAASKAVKVLDECMYKLYEEVIKHNGVLILTADHGNAEEMLKVSAEVDPELTHTLNPVPFILIKSDNKKEIEAGTGENIISKIMESKATLADVAPTVLELIGITKPNEMTGNSLINNLE
ncbi:MAG: 2,3-bisphosphoglycerate-independent phosphoglycerate mutase [Patescibacteria group bacterium]